MNSSQYPYRLLAPGPVPVPEAVLTAMSQKVLHHRTPEFMGILKKSWAGLKQVFKTEQPVMIIAGSGSAAMEAAVVNTLSPGDEALVVVSGKFGERWASICEAYGIRAHKFLVDWGKALDLDLFSKELKKYPGVKVVFSQVCETSTATLHPVREMAERVRKESSALFALDAITAVGCAELPMDEWKLDVVVGGSQKAFMIPTGLSFIALSEKAWEAQSLARSPKSYFDLAQELAANKKGDTMFSSPTSLMVGLGLVLEKIMEEGTEVVEKRCALLAKTTREFATLVGLTIYSESPSPSVTAIETPAGVQSGAIRDWLESERSITVMGGQDRLKDKIIRIGHMGHITNEDMMAFFKNLCEAIDTKLGTPTYSEKFKAIEHSLLHALKTERTLF